MSYIYLSNKYSRWYFAIIDKAKSQNRKKSSLHPGLYESHHIIPQCIGGIETVLLTPKEHYICHWLLIYMYKGPFKYKMKYALGRMKQNNKHQKRIFGSHQYEVMRKHIAEANVYFKKGTDNGWNLRKQRYGSSGGCKANSGSFYKGMISWHKGKLAPHGTHSRYTKKCRCDLCKKAETEYMKEWHKNHPDYERQRWQRRKLKKQLAI